MSTVQSLLKQTRLTIPKCQKVRALDIERSLNSGIPYTAVGGKRVRCCPEIIRFKLGTSWRLLFLKTVTGLDAYSLITRQSFDSELKRRR